MEEKILFLSFEYFATLHNIVIVKLWNATEAVWQIFEKIHGSDNYISYSSFSLWMIRR